MGDVGEPSTESRTTELYDVLLESKSKNEQADLGTSALCEPLRSISRILNMATWEQRQFMVLSLFCTSSSKHYVATCGVGCLFMVLMDGWLCSRPVGL